MHRRTFLGVSVAALLAGCGGGSDESSPQPDTLHVSERDVVVAGAAGTLFRVRPYERTVARLDAAGSPVWVTGTRGSGAAQFGFPDHAAVDAQGRLLVADRGNGRVAVLDAASGAWLGQIGSPGTGSGQFRHPRQIATSADRICVVDQLNHRVNVFDSGGRPIFALGLEGAGALDAPRGVAIDAQGRILVTNGGKATINRYLPDGTFDARVFAGAIVNPFGLAFDARGNLWVADGASGRVVAIAPDGAVQVALVARLPYGNLAGPLTVALSGRDIYVRAFPAGPRA